jgi:hypothetical protein
MTREGDEAPDTIYWKDREAEITETLDVQLQALADTLGEPLTVDDLTPAFVGELLRRFIEALGNAGQLTLAARYGDAFTTSADMDARLAQLTPRSPARSGPEDAIDTPLHDVQAEADDAFEQFERVEAAVVAWLRRDC